MLLREPYDILKSHGHLDRWTEVTFPAGAVISSIGEIIVHVYLILEGEVRTVLPLTDGVELEVARVGPGTFLGELAVLCDEPPLVDTIACTPCKMIRAAAGTYLDILRQDSELCLWAARYGAQGILNYTRDTVANIHRPLKGQIAEYLFRETGRRGEPLRLDKPALATLLGTTVRTVNRYLKELREEGVIALGEDGVRIADPQRLKRLISL